MYRANYFGRRRPRSHKKQEKKNRCFFFFITERSGYIIYLIQNILPLKLSKKNYIFIKKKNWAREVKRERNLKFFDERKKLYV